MFYQTNQQNRIKMTDIDSLANNDDIDREYNINASPEELHKMHLLIRSDDGDGLRKMLCDTRFNCDRKLMIWASHGNWKCVNELLTYYPLGCRDISKQVMDRLVKNAEVRSRLRKMFVDLVYNKTHSEKVFRDMGHLYWLSIVLANNDSTESEPFMPLRSSFFITILMMPEVPSASYLADGLVITSICSIISAVIVPNTLPCSLAITDGLPFTRI